MQTVLAIVMWVGPFATVVERWHARKDGATIVLAEKVLLVSALPLGLALQLAVEEAGFAPPSGTNAAEVIGVLLNGWAFKRRMQRR